MKMNMKKLFALILSLSLLFSLSACIENSAAESGGGGGALAGLQQGSTGGDPSTDNGLPVVNWKMASVWGEGTVHYESDKIFAQLVSDFTGGKFTITTYGEGALCSASQCFDYVADGTVQAAGDCPGYWTGRDLGFEPLCFTCDDLSGMDYLAWINEGGGLEVYQDIYSQHGITYFPIAIMWTESGLRTSRPCTSIEDMRSMKLRVGGVVVGRMLKSLGVNIVSMSGGELYEGIMRNTIDGCEFSTPGADASLGLHEVAPYLLLPCWYQSANINGVMINPDAYNALPVEYQEAIAKAAKASRSQAIARYFYEDALAFNNMVDNFDMQVSYLSDEDRALITETIEKTYNEVEAESPNFKMVRDAMRAYRETVDNYRDSLDDYGFGITK